VAAWEYLLQPHGRVWLLFFSVFFFLSGMLGRCPLYSLIGVGTKQNAKALDDSRDSM
jgi:Protein of unknown function (DUF2892)